MMNNLDSIAIYHGLLKWRPEKWMVGKRSIPFRARPIFRGCLLFVVWRIALVVETWIDNDSFRMDPHKTSTTSIAR